MAEGTSSAAGARRINKARIADFAGRGTIRFVGKVESYENSCLTLAAPDGGEVLCKLQENVPPPKSKFIEVIAEAHEDGSILQTGFMFELGNDIELDTVNNVINLTFHPAFRSFFDPVED